MGHITHDENGYPYDIAEGRKNYCLYDHGMTFNCVMEIYNDHKDSINQMCGITHDERGLDDPNEYTLLHLASDVDAYCGLE